MLGHYAWLARLADKARAERAGTCGEYVAFCPLSMGFLERTGIPRETFEVLIEQDADDEKLVTFFDRHVSPERRQEANRYVLDEHCADLDAQDEEEGRL